MDYMIDSESLNNIDYYTKYGNAVVDGNPTEDGEYYAGCIVKEFGFLRSYRLKYSKKKGWEDADQFQEIAYWANTIDEADIDKPTTELDSDGKLKFVDA